ncbi:MAG: DUF1285 domain-containing protein [Planctomycetes bacterium]|jgi:hypothetical protein|nr:DUF1285 domain-containing protein [Planctomycetota bacterium]
MKRKPQARGREIHGDRAAAIPGPGPIRVEDDGRWTCEGREIVHPEVLALFRRSLEPSPEGGWRLRVGAELRPVEVADTPLFVKAMRADGPGTYLLALDDGSSERLDPATLRRDARGFLAAVKGGAIPARFARTAYLDLAHLLEEAPEGGLLLRCAGGDVRVEDGS